MNIHFSILRYIINQCGNVGRKQTREGKTNVITSLSPTPGAQAVNTGLLLFGSFVGRARAKRVFYGNYVCL